MEKGEGWGAKDGGRAAASGGAVLLSLILLAGTAIAQSDPTVNDSDYDTNVTPADETYLDQAEAEANGTSTSGDPSVSDADFDTSAPANDEAYLDEAEAEASGDPSVSDADFDTSVPAEDEAYLDDAEREIAADGAAAGGNGAPGLGVWTTLAVLLGLAALVGRRSA